MSRDDTDNPLVPILAALAKRMMQDAAKAGGPAKIKAVDPINGSTDTVFDHSAHRR